MNGSEYLPKPETTSKLRFVDLMAAWWGLVHIAQPNLDKSPAWELAAQA